MNKSIKFSIDNNGVANLIFDLEGEKVNKLTTATLLELEEILDNIASNQEIKILLFKSDKKGIFIAGADINEIRDIASENDAYRKVSEGQEILGKIEALPFPSIAIINGACMGGGLELALACTYRVATTNPKTKLGLPEVNLGIIPGFGGTQRLPRLIGLSESLGMILAGKTIDAKKALKIGLIDLIIREEFFEKSLNDFITAILKEGEDHHILENRNHICKKRFFQENLLLGKFIIFYFAKKNLLEKTKGQYPAPLAALDVIIKTYNIDSRKDGFKIEAEEFSKLAYGPICKNLIGLFFTGEEIKKDSGTHNKEISTKKINNAGLLGAGIMGGGIAWLFSNYDIPVRMKDITQNAIALGYNQVLKIYSQLKKIRKYDDNQINIKLDRITSAIDYTGFDISDIVIEAIVENMDIKKKSLAELENNLKADAIIASNTSSLSITEMGSVLKHPERFAGMHFFNPVNRMPLVEVIRGDKTSDNTVASIVTLAKDLGKTPIVVKDVPGFLVNRILLPYINEAGFLSLEGSNFKKVDKIIEKFGMPMGPFTLADVVGIDVGYKVAKILHDGYGDRMKVCPLLEEISHNKELLGKKSNKGFFKYNKDGKTLSANSEINSVIRRVREKNNIKKSYLNDQDIIDRCMLIMINEASRCLEEGVVKNARYLDMAIIMGAGFPAFRGGILRYADQFGIKHTVGRLKEFSKKYGSRFEPSQLLIDMEKNEQKFYS